MNTQRGDYALMAKLKRLSLWAFIGFLVVTAIVAIVAVVSGDFGDFESKVLITSLIISGTSVCMMAYATFAERPGMVKVGQAGVALAVAAASLLLVGMWSERGEDEFWKVTLTFLILAVGLAYALLLLLPELKGRQRWVRTTSSVSIGALAAMMIVAIWVEFSEGWYVRVLAVMAILVALQTLVIPVLVWLRRMGEGERVG